MKKLITKTLFILIGISIISYFIYKTDLNQAYEKIILINITDFLIIFLPYTVVFICDTIGWKLLITKYKVNLLKLLQIKLFTDFINNIIPAGTILGETLKTKILSRNNIDLIVASSSVYLARVLIINSHIIYIILSVTLAISFVIKLEFYITLTAIALLILFLILLILINYTVFQKGTLNLILKFLDKIKLKIKFIQKQKINLISFDKKINQSFKGEKKIIFKSICIFLLGWIFSSVELYVVMIYINYPISLLNAIIIDCSNTVLRSILFFIPAGIGVVEIGYLGLFNLISETNYSNEEIIVFLIIKRIREIIFLVLGLIQSFFLNINIFNIKKSNSK